MKLTREEKIEQLKSLYPKGTLIRLTAEMNDPQPIEVGDEGEVSRIDDLGQIHINWKSGRRLALLPEEDSFEVITDK